MRFQPIDQFAAKLGADTRAAVYDGSKKGHEKRTQVLFDHFPDANRLRQVAGGIKQHVIENLDTYLPQTEARLAVQGVKVHWAATAEAANEAVLRVLRARGATRLVKAKTMVSEETELASFLARHEIECVETDLGEFIVQIDGDHPSHIVKPIIHKNRRDIAASFERHGLGAYNDDPATITARARAYLRSKYLEADVGLTGANFVVAESGRLVLVTNEGNSRFCLAATKCHIAMVGIEKLLPRDRDLSLLLNLLARSGTGQQLTVYTEFIRGARGPQQPDGPEEMHVIFVDNGRTDVLATKCRDILRCIRCGACLNVCPVYRQASGHAYRSVYPGPVGAVLSPLLAGERFSEKADLPKASSLCGACNEVCPVDIPIPDLLLRLRDQGKRAGSPLATAATPSMGGFALLASQPMAWRVALTGGRIVSHLPPAMVPVAALRAWTAKRSLPEWRGGEFRRWMRQRGSQKPEARGQMSEVRGQKSEAGGQRPEVGAQRSERKTADPDPGPAACSLLPAPNGRSDREQILGRVRAALAPLAERAALPDWERELVVMRAARGPIDPWTRFSESLRAVNGAPLERIADLVALLKTNAWTHGYCDPLIWPSLSPAFDGLTVDVEFDRGRVDDYQFGITRAAGAIAETGTLILDDATTACRLGALAPWAHIAVLRRETIHADLPAAVEAMGEDPNIVWVTGPSKTADVEGILIEGVHGPGVQVALLVE